MPDAQLIDEAVREIRRGAAALHFFEKIQSPVWIAPLRDRGVFADPPPAQAEEGNMISFPPWPASRYLVRMAAVAPDQVVETILGIPGTDNSRVLDDFLEASLAMPQDQAALLVPSALRWLASKYRLILPSKAGKLAARLAAAGYVEVALRLARALLALEPPPPAEGGDSPYRIGRERNPLPRMDIYEFGQILSGDFPAIVEAAGDEALRLLAELLTTAISFYLNRPGEEVTADASWIWRPAVEDSSQNLPWEVKGLLVDAVRNTSLQLSGTRESLERTVAQLRSHNSLIFQRISLHVVRLRLPESSELAGDLLTDPALMREVTQLHEYSPLLTAAFPLVTEDERRRILDWIELGPELGGLAERYAEQFGPDQVDARVETYRKAWQRDRLATVGQALPDDLSRRLKDLIDELGPAADEVMPFKVETWHGPTSPKTAEELQAMDVADILKLLREWIPSGDWRSPTVEGLGRALQTAIAARPQDFVPKLTEFHELDATYVRAAISGLREAAGKGQLLAWSDVVGFCEWVARKPSDDVSESAEFSSERDVSWVYSKREVAHLIEAGLHDGPASIAIDLRPRVWATILLLSQDTDPTPESEARFISPQMGPATFSINCVRGQALHAAVQYGLWVGRGEKLIQDGRIEHETFSSMPELRDTLTDRLDPSIEPSAAVHSVFGQYFPWLVLLDGGWARQHADHIFGAPRGRADLGDAAWETYLLFCQAYDNVFAILENRYSRAISELSSGADKDGADSPTILKLADHLLAMYVRGRLDLAPGGLVAQFYEVAPAKAKEEMIRRLGFQLERGPRIEDATLGRLQALWETRVSSHATPWDSDAAAESAHFGWWFASGRFDQRWAFEQLNLVLERGGSIEPAHMVVDGLAEAADEWPSEALASLRLVLAADRQGWLIMGSADKINSVLALALSSPRADVVLTARRLIDELGARGFLQFGSLLSAKSEGT